MSRPQFADAHARSVPSWCMTGAGAIAFAALLLLLVVLADPVWLHVASAWFLR